MCFEGKSFEEEAASPNCTQDFYCPEINGYLLCKDPMLGYNNTLSLHYSVLQKET